MFIIDKRETVFYLPFPEIVYTILYIIKLQSEFK